MFGGKKIACIIPARLSSTRLPEKVLVNIAGKPMLQWVWDAANKTTFFSDIVFAIDSEKTAKIIKDFGGKFLMTSENCKSGTDRLIEVMHSGEVEADIFVNWQADEPFINPQMILELLKTCNSSPADVWTLKKKIVKDEDIISPNIAKVVCDNEGHALYFSRSTIPYYRNQNVEKVYYKHIGIYAYTVEALRKIAKTKHSYLEEAEALEQLRFLQHKISIQVHEVENEVIGIDTIEDVEKAEKMAKDFIV